MEADNQESNSQPSINSFCFSIQSDYPKDPQQNPQNQMDIESNNQSSDIIEPNNQASEKGDSIDLSSISIQQGQNRNRDYEYFFINNRSTRPSNNLNGPSTSLLASSQEPTNLHYSINRVDPYTQLSSKKVQEQIDRWVYDRYLVNGKSLDDVLFQMGQKNKKQNRVDYRMLQKSVQIFRKELPNNRLPIHFIDRIIQTRVASELDSFIENKDILDRFLNSLQRKNLKESFPIKAFFDILINPVDLRKNQKIMQTNKQIIQERFIAIENYCDQCQSLEEEQKIHQMDLGKKVLRSEIYQMVMEKYWIQQKIIKYQKFDDKFKYSKPLYLARLLKKIAMDMGKEGNGKFNTKALRTNTLMRDQRYRSYFQLTLVDLDISGLNSIL